MLQITIKSARVNMGLTQEDVAKAVGVTKKTVGSWESGKTLPKLEKIEPLCNLLGVQYDNIKWGVRQ